VLDGHDPGDGTGSIHDLDDLASLGADVLRKVTLELRDGDALRDLS
jgi:hypothetical protein